METIHHARKAKKMVSIMAILTSFLKVRDASSKIDTGINSCQF